MSHDSIPADTNSEAWICKLFNSRVLHAIDGLRTLFFARRSAVIWATMIFDVLAWCGNRKTGETNVSGMTFRSDSGANWLVPISGESITVFEQTKGR